IRIHVHSHAKTARIAASAVSFSIVLRSNITMISIGIVGTGIAGLQLGLLLQQRGIPTTLYAERTPEQQRAGGILNNVVRFGHTRERERALGVNHWDNIGPDLTSVSVAVGGEHPFG